MWLCVNARDMTPPHCLILILLCSWNSSFFSPVSLFPPTGVQALRSAADFPSLLVKSWLQSARACVHNTELCFKSRMPTFDMVWLLPGCIACHWFAWRVWWQALPKMQKRPVSACMRRVYMEPILHSHCINLIIYLSIHVLRYVHPLNPILGTVSLAVLFAFYLPLYGVWHNDRANRYGLYFCVPLQRDIDGFRSYIVLTIMLAI